ncbi:MAG: methylated-DNA--[protein]-cysteine S-methyltransferase [Planctomycetota bacterium]|nr:MAG: methylated-DNA--[protein]-cysteine S-methyltransferase [Planctomycetota bacterium]
MTNSDPFWSDIGRGPPGLARKRSASIPTRAAEPVALHRRQAGCGLSGAAPSGKERRVGALDESSTTGGFAMSRRETHSQPTDVAFSLIATRWGTFGYVASRGRLIAAYLPDREERILRRLCREWPKCEPHPHLLPELETLVRAYFAGRPVDFSGIDVDLSTVSPFRRKVLKACQRIPFGARVSYAELARRVGHPRAARAVGGAMAANPLPLIVPCHRVLRGDGGLGGFSAPQGISLKRRMLELEKNALASGAIRKRRRDRSNRAATVRERALAHDE